MDSNRFNLSEVCGPIRITQNNPETGRIEGGLTDEQLRLIGRRLDQDHKILKLMFHILPPGVYVRRCRAHEEISRHPLSGNLDSDMYNFFMLGTPSLASTFEKGRSMALAFERAQKDEDFVERTWMGSYIPPTELRGVFSEVVEQFRDNVASLRQGELLIIPSGTIGHSMAYAIKAKTANECTFSIINTGLGVGVLGGCLVNRKAQAPSFDVPRELLNSSNLIDSILAFAYATQAGKTVDPVKSRANFKDALDQFYKKVKRIFSQYPEYKQEHIVQAQGQGTCTATCLHASLELFAPESLEEMHATSILTAAEQVAKVHRCALGIAQNLPQYVNGKQEVARVVQKASFYSWWALQLKDILNKDPQCVQVTNEELLGSLNLEYERIKGDASLTFHLLPHDIHASEHSLKRSEMFPDRKHPLSGNSSEVLYRAFRELVPEDLKYIFESGGEIAKDFSLIRNRINSSNGSYDKRIFGSVRAKILSGIQKLQPGELFLIDGGVEKHAFVYAVRDNEDGTCVLSIINTGFGSDHAGNTAKAPAFVVPKELLLKNGRFIQIIIDTAEAIMRPDLSDEEWGGLFEENMGVLLYNLRRLCQGCKEGYFEHFTQVYGTCTASCLQAAIQVFAPRVYDEFRLNSLQRAQDGAIQCHKDLLALKEKLPWQGSDELSEKIDDLLYELFYLLENLTAVIEGSRAVARPALATAKRSLGKLVRVDESSPAGAAAASFLTPNTAAAAFSSPYTTAAASSKPCSRSRCGF